MSNDNNSVPTTVTQYRTLIDWSEKHFGDPFEILEAKARTRVEHGLSRNLGGFALALNPNNPPLKRRIILKYRLYLYRCERIAELEDEHGTFYTLISLNEDEASDVTERNPGRVCTRAVCVLPSSGLSNRLYLLY